MQTSKYEDAYKKLYSCISIFLILIIALLSPYVRPTTADLIMMGENGMPNIIENDDDSDVIMMPGMGGMMINDDMVLMG